MARQISYGKRTFDEIRSELKIFIQQNYPELYADFDDSSIGALLIDLCAAVGDNLSFHTDRLFQETQLSNAQQRRSILEIAKNLSFKVPAKRASATVCDFSVTVPVLGDSFDESYLPVIRAGAQVVGGGKVFETKNDIDFASPFSSFNSPNRTIIPMMNQLNTIVAYTITKREIVYNGVTRIFKKILSEADIKPFMEIVLQDNSVIEVSSVIVVNGLVEGNATDDQFSNDDVRFHEVDHLAQQYKFIDEDASNSGEIKSGKWVRIKKKFLSEFTERGYCKLTFGGGNGDMDMFYDAVSEDTLYNQLESYLYSSALGEKPSPNSTLFVKYRVGGGSNTNIARGTLNSMGNHVISVYGSDIDINSSVKRSITVTNPIPAFGGKDEPSIEEIRNLISYNYSAQGRCITLPDYLSRVHMMDGRYGAPFKVTAFKESNKVVLPILGLDENGKLSNSSTSVLKENISEYLAGFRSVNDYIEVRDGRIFNLGYDIVLYIDDKADDYQVITKAVAEVVDFHDIYSNTMNQDMFLGGLIEKLNNISNVYNVMDVKVYSKTSGNYSPNRVEMQVDEGTGEIQLENNTLYSSVDAMFEIKEPTKDVRITLKRRTQLR